MYEIKKFEKNKKKSWQTEKNNVYYTSSLWGQHIIAELCKGSTADSDSVCLGSNPSSATKTEQANACSVFCCRQDSKPEEGNEREENDW